MEKTHHVAEYKKKIVADIVKFTREYPIIGVVNMENLPAPQLQTMKARLRGKVHLFMAKKRLMKIALEQVKNDKEGIEELEKHFQGMPALLFTKDSPFKLSKALQQSKSQAPAKAGQISPKDIIIPKGPTSFAPGPIISELSSVGIKTGVESGKVAVKEDSLVAKKGDKINPKVAEVLTRMGIEPMEVGLDLVAAYENGVIYPKDILLIDEKEFMNKLNSACSGAFNLAIFIGYPTKDTIKTLLGKAFNDAKVIGLSQNIIDSGIIEELLGKAERSMLSLKDTADIEVQEKPKEKIVEKEIKEEKPAPEVKEEKVKEAVKPIEEVKKEEKPVEKKEEKPKEEVKDEIKSEVKELKEPEKKIEEKAKKEIKLEKKEEEILEKREGVVKEEQRIEEEAKERAREKAPFEKEVEEGVKEEEEKQLERQRIEEEKKLEDLEEEKSRIKEEIKTEEEKPKSEIDKKVKEMVEETKKFAVGEKGPTAEDLLKEAKEEDKKEIKEEIKKEEPEKEKKEKVPSAHELVKKKKKDEQKEIEDLTKELIKKGSLRNKK